MNAAASHLPDLDSGYEVDEKFVMNFRENGHVKLEQVATSSEVKHYRQAIRDAVMKYNTEIKSLEERDTYGKAFIQVTNLWQKDEAVRKFVLAKRFAHVATQLLGVSGVRLYHDQALIKEAGGGHTPWHQDQYYWPLDTENTITMWMPLIEVSQDMGTMTFASGSHKKGRLNDLPISDESEEVFKDLIAQHNFEQVNYGSLRAGDATFHSGWTLHSAPGNQSEQMREVMTIIYYPDGARLIEPRNENQRLDLEAWFPGQEPGELAVSNLNPLLYSE